jgi:hypothetical protein
VDAHLDIHIDHAAELGLMDRPVPGCSGILHYAERPRLPERRGLDDLPVVPRAAEQHDEVARDDVTTGRVEIHGQDEGGDFPQVMQVLMGRLAEQGRGDVGARRRSEEVRPDVPIRHR